MPSSPGRTPCTTSSARSNPSEQPAIPPRSSRSASPVYDAPAARPSVTSDLGIPLRIRPGRPEGRAALDSDIATHASSSSTERPRTPTRTQRHAIASPTATSSTGRREVPSTSHPNRRLHTNVAVHNARRSTPRSNDPDSFHGPEAESLSGRSCVQEYREHYTNAKDLHHRVAVTRTLIRILVAYAIPPQGFRLFFLDPNNWRQGMRNIQERML